MNTKTPKWFTGVVYSKGAEVTNPHSNESITLNGLELALYEVILGVSAMCESGQMDGLTQGHVKLIQREYTQAKDWFLKNNIEAYNILID